MLPSSSTSRPLDAFATPEAGDQLLYLRFPSTESAKTWFALLQSFTTVPTHLTPSPAGGPNPVWQRQLEPTYRMKTRLSLRVCEFRSPSTTVGSSAASTHSLSTIQDDVATAEREKAVPAAAMFVEIQAVGRGVANGAAGGRMIGRTSVIRRAAAPVSRDRGFEWEQEFGFEDLGEEVRVVVWKERKMGREGKVGEVNLGGGRAGMREGEV